MQDTRLSNLKLNGYVAARKFINSFKGQVFLALVLVSVLSIAQLIYGNAAVSPLLTGQLDPIQWITALALPIVIMSFIYSFFTAPVELAAKAVVLDDSDVKIFRGLTASRKTSIPYTAIDRVELQQSLPQRLIQFSRVSIRSNDTHNETVTTLPYQQARKLMKRIAHNAAESA